MPSTKKGLLRMLSKRGIWLSLPIRLKMRLRLKGASRRFYNNAAQEYNTSREQFPAILVAGPFGFHPREFFEAPEGREALQEAPVVDFDT